MTPFDYFKSNFGPEICITNAACDYNRTGAQGRWSVGPRHSKAGGALFVRVWQGLRGRYTTLVVTHHHTTSVRSRLCSLLVSLGTSPSGDESVIRPTVS